MGAVHKTILKFNLLPKENVMSETATPEVKREKVFIPKNYSVDQIQQKFKLTRPASRRAKKTGSM